MGIEETGQRTRAQDTGDDDTSPLCDADLLLEILRAVVDKPEAVRVEELLTGDHLQLLIHVDPEDRRLVIGKQGWMVTLLRRLFGVVAAKQQKRITVEVVESEQDRMRFRGPPPPRPTHSNRE